MRVQRTDRQMISVSACVSSVSGNKKTVYVSLGMCVVSMVGKCDTLMYHTNWARTRKRV